MKKISWQYLVLLISWLAYGLVTILFVGRLGPAIIISSLIPIIISGLVLGMKGGILSGLLITVYNMMFLGYVNPPFITVFGSFPLLFGSAIGIMIGGVVGRIRDLGVGLKERDSLLSDSDERFRRSLDDLPEGCQILGFDRRFRYVNDAVIERIGIKRQNLLGKTAIEAGIVNTDSKLHPTIEKCLDGRVSSDLEEEVVFPDGRVRWLEFSIRPVPEGVFVLSRDRTERKKGEEKVLESERRYRGLFDSSAVVI
ncbi:MAG: PAS domain S-box protein [candidate division Zixibacteria bacterium]|nr:PAS domain S-box protein [candidate division Zixibacteria bacterium]